MESTLRRTWAEIDLDALAHNYRTLRAHVGPAVKFLGVVKADGYGHGAIQVSRTLEALGAGLSGGVQHRRGHGAAPQRHRHAHPDPGPHAEGAGEEPDRPAHHPGRDLCRQGGGVQRRGGKMRRHAESPHQGGHRAWSRLGYLCGGEMFDTGVEGICHACNAPDWRPRASSPTLPWRMNRTRTAAPTRWPSSTCSAGSSTPWSSGWAGASPSGTAPTPARWRRIRRRIWTWCGPASCCTAAPGRPKRWGSCRVMTLKTTVSTIKTYAPGVDISYGRLFTTPRTTRMGVVPYGYADDFSGCCPTAAP